MNPIEILKDAANAGAGNELLDLLASSNDTGVCLLDPVLRVKSDVSLLKLLEYQSCECVACAVRIDPESISFIDNPSIELCKAAIQANPESIKYMKGISDEVIFFGIQESVTVYGYLECKNPFYTLLQIQRYPQYIRYLSDEEKNKVVCEVAVTQDSTLFKYVPDRYKEHCIKIIDNFRKICLDTISESRDNIDKSMLGFYPFDDEIKSLIDVDGNLDLSYSAVEYLPDGLVICGNLDLSNSNIKKLPKYLTVYGDLNISNTCITAANDSMYVRGRLIK